MSTDTVINSVFVLRTAIPRILTAFLAWQPNLGTNRQVEEEPGYLTLSITLAMEELSVCSVWTRSGIFTLLSSLIDILMY